MVRLTRIYTRLGDEGDTHLGDMSRVRKTSARVAAYGDVDELNSLIGVARAQDPGDARDARLAAIQNDLFDLGADLCVPRAARAARGGCGSPAARWSAWSAGATRSTRSCPRSPASCSRRGARRRRPCTTPARSAGGPSGRPWRSPTPRQVGREALAYLNRLSDLLFILARAANAGAGGDVLWEPGEGR